LEQVQPAGNRLTDKSALPNDGVIRDWIGAELFQHWIALQKWIDASYPGVFVPDWVYGGKQHGWSLRYKKSRAFCTLVPEYRSLFAVVVLGRAERNKVEERRDELDPDLMTLYDEAKTFHDGKWLKLGMSSTKEWERVTDLLALKRPRRAGV